MTVPEPARARTLDQSSALASRYTLLSLRLSMGVVYVWFGAVKFFPGLSPAEHLVTRTFELLSFGTVGPSVSLPLVATMEVLIGLGLLTGMWMRTTLILLAAQLIGAMAPLVLLPRDTWKIVPFVLTMDGQFIVKDLIVIAGGIVLALSIRNSTSSNRFQAKR